MVHFSKLVLVPTIQQIRDHVKALEDAADIMDVRRVLGEVSADDVQAARDKAEAARRHMEHALQEKRV